MIQNVSEILRFSLRNRKTDQLHFSPVAPSAHNETLPPPTGDEGTLTSPWWQNDKVECKDRHVATWLHRLVLPK